MHVVPIVQNLNGKRPVAELPFFVCEGNCKRYVPLPHILNGSCVPK